MTVHELGNLPADPLAGIASKRAELLAAVDDIRRESRDDVTTAARDAVAAIGDQLAELDRGAA